MRTLASSRGRSPCSSRKLQCKTQRSPSQKSSSTQKRSPGYKQSPRANIGASLSRYTDEHSKTPPLDSKLLVKKIDSDSKSHDIKVYKSNFSIIASNLSPKTQNKNVEKARGAYSSSNSSDLSYSPARRDPERYLDILEDKQQQEKIANAKTEKHEVNKNKDNRINGKEKVKETDDRNIKKVKDGNPSRDSCDGNRDNRRERDIRHSRERSHKRSKPGPVVRLQSQSEEESENDNRIEKSAALDEYQEPKRERDLKDIKLLEQLKTGIAAKAKEKIKTIEKLGLGTEPLVAALADSSLVDTIVSKVSTATVAAAESAARRSRSRSRRSRSRTRVRTRREGASRRSNSRARSSHHYSSSSSRSRSRTHRSSRSRSQSRTSQSSCSSSTTSRSASSETSEKSSRTGSRSPSIPRRRGSPSFLDRRRITSYKSSRRESRR